MNELIGNLKNDFAQTVQDAGSLAGRDGFKRQLGSLARLDVPPEVIRALPAEFAKRHCLLPFEINNGTIHIATAAPGNQRVIADIRLLSGLEVEEFEAPATEIIEKIAECYQVTVEKMIENLNPEKAATGEGKNLQDIEVMANEPTVVNLVNLIISTAAVISDRWLLTSCRTFESF